MSPAAGVAHNLRAQRQGNGWRCPCPLGCGYALSLADGEDGTLLAHCFGGHEFDEIMMALVEYGLLDDDTDSAGPVYAGNGSASHRRDDAARIAHAVEIYRLGTTDERIGIYLRSRGIALTSPVLRFSEQAPHRLGIRLPAMLAPVSDVHGEQTGVHMTFLRPDSSGKADLSKEHQRQTNGVIRGGTIRLAAHDPERPLLIAEGIETALSAMQIFALPGWAAGYAANLKDTLALPPAVQHLVIAVDHDKSGAGQRNAIEAAQRWEAEGRTVRIVMPKTVDNDFNDILKGRA
jgi:putative DNA primase/helicase